MRPTFYEFFAGGGMARAGLGDGWQCLFANDIDPKKGAAYVANWGDKEFKLGDIHALKMADLPGHADLAWASFPCQDLSLAGNGAGLNGERSGAFWGFWAKLNGLKTQRRLPRTVVIENVCGLLTSHAGRDFAELCRALSLLGYDFGAMVIDAALFLPQSRPRLFIVAVHRSVPLPAGLRSEAPSKPWHPAGLQAAFWRLPPDLRKKWIWWSMPAPPPHGLRLADLIEESPSDVPWHTSEQTARLLSQMPKHHRAKVEGLRKSSSDAILAVYKRMRGKGSGRNEQRAEVRFDGNSGCLRTPAGGSSRQILLILKKQKVRSRLISAREAARLLGVEDSYQLPLKYNDAYHLAGDGLAIPVVRHLAQFLIEPIAIVTSQRSAAAA